MGGTVEYEVYALKFAEHPGAPRAAFFFGPIVADPDTLLRIDYFFWVLRSADHVVLFDTGFTPETARKRGRPLLRSPEQAVVDLGIDPREVSMVVMSHLHYDHAGCWDSFPEATFILQDAELAFWTGRYLPRSPIKWLVELADLQAFVRLNHENRVRFVDGDEELLPGLSVHLVGGHSPGSQILRVDTTRGVVVLASDAAPMYENFVADAPFGILTDVPRSLDAFDRMHALADAPDLIIPGHDPAVLDRFDAVPGQDGLTVRIA